MPLVNYSDSESESELNPATPAVSKSASRIKPALSKTAPGRIRVNLPTVEPELNQTETPESTDGSPAKRARTGGNFSGFNSILPAPKRTAQSASKAGISLKTSSEAAFSRERPPPAASGVDEVQDSSNSNGMDKDKHNDVPSAEPKLVGKATRFLPLSVAKQQKKKKPSLVRPLNPEHTHSVHHGQHSDMAKAVTEKAAQKQEEVPKQRRSLFSMQPAEEVQPQHSSIDAYEPLLAHSGHTYLPEEVEKPSAVRNLKPAPDPNSLEATANDLNLTPAQRRQLFGRDSGMKTNVMHFNMESEYAANEHLRQNSETSEHRTVKAIAPGKHSLQQLVNNARTQSDALEDKWAEGRRNKGSMR